MAAGTVPTLSTPWCGHLPFHTTWTARLACRPENVLQGAGCMILRAWARRKSNLSAGGTRSAPLRAGLRQWLLG